MKWLVSLSLLIISIQFSIACGNEYGHSLSGKKLHTRYFYLTESMRTFNKPQVLKRIDDLYLSGDLNSKEFLSDLAFNLMKLGKIDSAITILEPLAIKFPQEYNIIANLGTAYELNGQLGKALEYIEKGIQINPNSHHKSEWIHKQIIIAKIIAIKSPKYYSKNTILNEDSLREKLIKQDLSLRMLQSQIRLQIRTRIPLVMFPYITDNLV